MKKKFLIFLFLMGIVLVSCGGSKRSVIVDNPIDSIKGELALDTVKNGKSLNQSLNTSKAYYDVKVANDVKNSLFYNVIDLDDYLDDSYKETILNVLYFNKNVYTSDVTAFIKEMNSKDYGVKAEMLGINFNLEENSKDFIGKYAISQSAPRPKNYDVKTGDPTKLVVVYVPVYCIYNDGTQNYTEIYLMVPVYYAYAYESTLSNYTSGIKNYQITTDENNLLPSKEN